MRFFFLCLTLISPSIFADSYLIKNGRIITMGEMGVIENGDVRIRDGLISEVAEYIDADPADKKLKLPVPM